MTTTVIFKIDKKLKEAAQKKAKQLGITLTELYTFYTREYVEGRFTIRQKSLTIIPEPKKKKPYSNK